MNARALLALSALVVGSAAAAGGGPLGKRKVLRRQALGDLPPSALPIAATIQKGRYREALHSIEDNMDRDPDNAEWFAMYGSAWARLAMYADAEAAFELSPGSVWYHRMGYADHADTLRAFGQGRRAADLRLEARWDSDNGVAEVMLLEGAVYDLLATGDAEGAQDLAEEAVAAYPGSALAHVALAEVLLDEGDRDGAEWELWWVERSESQPAPYHALRARLALQDGDLDEAEQESAQAFKQHFRDRSVLAVRAEVLRREDAAGEALRLIDGPRGGMQEDPVLMAVEAAAALDLGETERAAEVIDRAHALYPDDPTVLRALAYTRSGSTNP